MTENTASAPAAPAAVAPSIQYVPQTPRDFLASLTPPLAIPGTRGRFGKAGVKALDEARALGFRFIGDEGHPGNPEKTVRTPRVKAEKTTVKAEGKTEKTVTAGTGTASPAAAKASFVAKDVRAWAKANGVKVGERGRIHPTVIEAFVKANPKAAKGVKASTSDAAAAPAVKRVKVRSQRTGYVIDKNGVKVVQDHCGYRGKDGMFHTIQTCDCKGGPRAMDYLTGAVGNRKVVRLTLAEAKAAPVQAEAVEAPTA